MTPVRPHWTVLLLALVMFMAPTLGSPTEELLQDTFKSILVSLFALAAAWVYFWNLRKDPAPVCWHSILWLPLGLTAYALGSMLWSHAYLGGVEAVRWFIFSVILFLGLNTFSHDRVTHLAWGIHLGAVGASLWAALQFWSDFQFFSQGPAPGSTFVNRNFFGEYLVCTLPFSVLLLTRLRDKISVFVLIFSLGFNIVALMMTGTRSALLGLLALTMLIPGIVYVYRDQVVSTGWKRWHLHALAAVLFGSIALIGSIDNANAGVMKDFGTGDAIDRATKRALSMTEKVEYTERSFSIRAIMWRATVRMIADNPWRGVGAGAWEVEIPRYQDIGSQLENDYYAHNEILQLVAEYGIVGCLFLLSLAFYLVWAAVKTWNRRRARGREEGALRALTLSSLLVLLLVSNAGFPWRMASTGALFSLSLGVLLASDLRLRHGGSFLLRQVQSNPIWMRIALLVTAASISLALYISQQAIICESKIVLAVKTALTISQSADPKDPRWDKAKSDMLENLREGIEVNPHYRKLTPMVADSVAGWGDWENALWIWESVLESRPHVVAMLANVTRAYMQGGDLVKAQTTLARAQLLQPKAPAVTALEVMLAIRMGKDQEAAVFAKKLLLDGGTDIDLVRSAYFLGMRIHNSELAILSLEVRIKNWPDQAVDGWLKLGNIYAAPEVQNDEKAVECYGSALASARPEHREQVVALIPAIYRARLRQVLYSLRK